MEAEDGAGRAVGLGGGAAVGTREALERLAA